MKLNEVKDNKGARVGKTRLGRGIGCSKGKTCGRGGKGQTARTGVRINGFEGGQMPLHRRLPKRGFNNIHAGETTEINLGLIEKFVKAGKLDASKVINGEALVKAGVLSKVRGGLKLLAKGALTSKLVIEVDAASASAKAAVEKAGGKLVLPTAA